MNGSPESSPPSVEWTVRPLEERPLAGLVAILVIGLLGVMVWIAAGDWIWGVLSVLLLLATISRFLMRSRVMIGPEGIIAEFPLVTRRIPWERVARIRYDARAALVRTDRRRLLG
ncbi:MAG: PH domain-containing protein, partial [Planctomycetota bacterium]|nr:PH domain-containing protein [Planctomycetota bacterium]